MEIYENTNSELTVIDSTETGGEITVIDKYTDELGTVISQTAENKLIVHWQDSDESEVHEEFELISVYAPNVKLVIERESDDFEYVQNPFGGWLADKVKDSLKRRKAGKAFKKRLKAESVLEKAVSREKEAVSAYKENPLGLFSKKKQFYVDFWGDGEFHQTVITAKNESAAVEIAKRRFETFSLDSVKKTNPSELERTEPNPEPRHRRFVKN
jgi:hypothetical protein